MTILSIGVVFVHAAGDSGDSLFGDGNVARGDGEAVVSLRSVDGRGFSDGRDVGILFTVVVVVGVWLHIEDDVVAQFAVHSNVPEVGGHVVEVVLSVEVVDRVGVVGEEKVEAGAGKRGQRPGRGRTT